jgi:hypothetical protein
MPKVFHHDIPKEYRLLDFIILEANETRCLEKVIEVYCSGAYLCMQKECREI